MGAPSGPDSRKLKPRSFDAAQADAAQPDAAQPDAEAAPGHEPAPAPDVYDRFGTLLRYPREGWVAVARETAVALEQCFPAAAAELATVVEALAPLGLGELEELYTRAFDMNPECTLDLGWHLFGENYGRGGLLVLLGERMRVLGLAQGGDLADHLPCVLRLIGRLSLEEAGSLVHVHVRPALAVIRKNLASADCPYASLVGALIEVLAVHFPPLATASEAAAELRASPEVRVIQDAQARYESQARYEAQMRYAEKIRQAATPPQPTEEPRPC